MARTLSEFTKTAASREAIDATASAESTLDAREVSHFDSAAEIWWDEGGVARWLHAMNPVRVDYLCGLAAKAFSRTGGRLDGLRILDVGCGAGVLSEPLARLGANVVGVDPAPTLIETAERHAAQTGVAVDYRCTTPEAMTASEQFDMVLALDVVEHVANPAFFLETCARLTRSGGLVVVSTFNRTVMSYLQAIVIAERVMRFLPRGSHHWSRFVTPAEVEAALAPLGFAPFDLKGMTMNLRRWKLQMSGRTGVTYFMAMRRA